MLTLFMSHVPLPWPGEGLARIDLLGIFSGARGQVFAATKNPVAASGGWPLTKFGELD
jgi:hypothetical protein